MSDDAANQGTDISGEGQVADAPAGSASDATPSPSNDGQPSGGSDAATTTGGQPTEEHFFDPAEFDRLTASLPDDAKSQIIALQKQLQGSYTKKTQAIADNRKKIEAYNAFAQDPVSYIKQAAKQYGLNLTPATTTENAAKSWTPESGDPESWNDVVGFLLEKINGNLSEQIKPMVNEFQTIKKQTIETQLSEIDPTWTQYEDEMMATLKEHPTMAHDPAKLYQMSVPAEVLESRATQRALKKLEAKTKAANVGGTSTTTQKTNQDDMPKGKMSFADSVKWAKQKLANDGMHPK